MYAFPLLICLCQFNFQIQPGTLRGLRKTFASITHSWENEDFKKYHYGNSFDLMDHHKESNTTERLPLPFSLSCIGEGNGNPLQCSCLENPRDRGAWWAAIYGVAQSWTRLKWLSSSSREAWHAAVHGVAKSRTRLSDWADSVKPELWTTTFPRLLCSLVWGTWLRPTNQRHSFKDSYELRCGEKNGCVRVVQRVKWGPGFSHTGRQTPGPLAVAEPTVPGTRTAFVSFAREAFLVAWLVICKHLFCVNCLQHKRPRRLPVICNWLQLTHFLKIMIAWIYTDV